MADLHIRLGKLTEALEDIGAAGDAARLQLHLLSMQARGELGTSIEALELKIDRGIEQAVQAAAGKTRLLTKTVQEYLGQKPTREATSASVRSIMTQAIHSCSPDDPLARAAQIMWDTDCGAVPVVNAEQHLCGIITDRDICMAAYTKGASLTAVRVGDVMTRNVHTCRLDDTLARAATLMAEGQVRRLPVLDADGRTVGIVSLADIASNAGVLGQKEAQALVFQLLRGISKRRSSSESQHLAAE